MSSSVARCGGIWPASMDFHSPLLAFIYPILYRNWGVWQIMIERSLFAAQLFPIEWSHDRPGSAGQAGAPRWVGEEVGDTGRETSGIVRDPDVLAVREPESGASACCRRDWAFHRQGFVQFEVGAR